MLSPLIMLACATSQGPPLLRRRYPGIRWLPQGFLGPSGPILGQPIVKRGVEITNFGELTCGTEESNLNLGPVRLRSESVVVDTTRATNSLRFGRNGRLPPGNYGNDAWFRFTAPEDGAYVFGGCNQFGTFGVAIFDTDSDCAIGAERRNIEYFGRRCDPASTTGRPGPQGPVQPNINVHVITVMTAGETIWVVGTSANAGTSTNAGPFLNQRDDGPMLDVGVLCITGQNQGSSSSGSSSSGSSSSGKSGKSGKCGKVGSSALSAVPPNRRMRNDNRMTIVPQALSCGDRVQGTTVGANNAIRWGQGVNGAAGAPEVWYQFDVTEGGYYLLTSCSESFNGILFNPRNGFFDSMLLVFRRNDDCTVGKEVIQLNSRSPFVCGANRGTPGPGPVGEQANLLLAEGKYWVAITSADTVRLVWPGPNLNRDRRGKSSSSSGSSSSGSLTPGNPRRRQRTGPYTLSLQCADQSSSSSSSSSGKKGKVGKCLAGDAHTNSARNSPSLGFLGVTAASTSNVVIGVAVGTVAVFATVLVVVRRRLSVADARDVMEFEAPVEVTSGAVVNPVYEETTDVIEHI